MISNRAAWPDERTVFSVDRIQLPVIGGPHPYAIAERDSIARNWQQEVAANPALFDGPMMLPRWIRIEDGVISGDMHMVPFSAFLLWRKTRPLDAALHIFALPVILSSDGAVIAIRMAAHTANPGRVYCAAGSLDPSDVEDGFCNLDSNMAREVREETGLDLADATDVAGLQAMHDNGVVTVFRVYRFSVTARDLINCIDRHLAADAQPEIDEAVAIHSPDPHLYPYSSFMPPVLAWVFQTVL
ncbi:NUDIX hydrolase [Pararhizobium gei]|uniref:NUDIX hydrolase n=1 Tax=Pararhizobium gei TaxID=1395951 RepID=UPI0023D9BCAB|nr:NUDIX hydrolase [Rhizobium gei]